MSVECAVFRRSAEAAQSGMPRRKRLVAKVKVGWPSQADLEQAATMGSEWAEPAPPFASLWPFLAQLGLGSPSYFQS